MKLSVIIVNYNVKYFLEQCLHSVRQAATGIEMETIVIDNHSTDGSIAYLQPKFPEVWFIDNGSNTGFAKACNEGWERATGQYILFLNPDTLLAEDALTIPLHFLETHTGAGAAGVQMLDGSGRFLKESKRSFPSPLTSLFKLAGLARLFPHSPLFSRYHLGHLPSHHNHEVDVLAGAYMMIRRDVLEKVGAFDEQFFMYGEDVDLSYRIQKSGYKNYYLAGTAIIHFKGESTKRGSLNYVRMFYQAMRLFVKKHYGGTRAGIFNAAIHFAIWIRAILSAIAKLVRWIGLPMLDALFILLSFWVVKDIWNTYVRTGIIYPKPLLLVAFPAFTLVYLVVAYYAGMYDKYYRQIKLVRATLIATLVLLALYALLPESYRFSRGIVVFGAVLAFLFISLLRWLMLQTGLLPVAAHRVRQPHILIAGTPQEYKEIQHLFKHRRLRHALIGRIAVDGRDTHAVGDIGDINKLVQATNAQEIIFCMGGALSYRQVMESIKQIKAKVRLRFHAAHSCSIVGSDASTSVGEAIAVEPPFPITKAGNRRTKRLIDVVVALFSFLLFPLPLFLVTHPGRFFKNCWLVLLAQKTWVGYSRPPAHLPPLPPSVLAANGFPHPCQQPLPAEHLQQMDYWYARDYEPVTDIKLIIKNYPQLGG